MRVISILLLAILLFILLVSGCGPNDAGTAQSPAASALSAASSPASPEPLPPPATTAAASPQADPELEAAAEAFIAAQNAQDWNAFIDLWTDSEQVFYNDFFAYPDNAEKHNGYYSIKSARLAVVFDITRLVKDDATYYNMPFIIWDDADRDYIKSYDDYSAVILKAYYKLENGFWDYREGLNYRVLILAPENGQWKVLKDFQGYPGAAVYFNDPLPPEDTTGGNHTEEETDNLADGTVHYTKMITGYYIGMQTGDYNHPGFRTTEGEEFWFWTASDVADYEALHRYQKAEITYENCDKYIDEANSVINIDRITGITLLD